MTKKALLIVAIAAGVMLLPGLSQTPAVAGVHWSIGTGFSVGGLDFNVAFGMPFGYLAEEIFYRTHQALHYAGYRCHGGCSFRDGYYYHHRDCPLIRHHFRSYGYSPRVDWWITPRLYDRGWRSYSHYRSYRNRYDRYRYDRHRYDRYRYDRHRDDRYRYDRRRFLDNDWDSDSDSDRYDRRRRDWDRGRSDRYDRDRRDRDRSRFDRDRDRRDSRRRGSDTRSPRRRGG